MRGWWERFRSRFRKLGGDGKLSVVDMSAPVGSVSLEPNTAARGSVSLSRLNDPQTLLRHFRKHTTCPDCGGPMYEGPSGGLSMNIRCGNCGSTFNVNPFEAVRI